MGMVLKQKSTKRFLIIGSILWGLSFVPLLLCAVFSVFMFDAPGSEKNPFVWITFFSLLGGIPLCVLAFFSWLPYLKAKYGWALLMILSPFISVLGIVLGIYGIQVLHHGKFN